MEQGDIIVEVITVAPGPVSLEDMRTTQPSGTVVREESVQTDREARERVQELRAAFEEHFRAMTGLVHDVDPGEWVFDWEDCCARAGSLEIPTVRIRVRE